MNEITTILTSAGYSVTKNITITPDKEQINSVSVYCIGMMLPFETKKIKNILKNYNVSVTPLNNLEEIQISLKK